MPQFTVIPRSAPASTMVLNITDPKEVLRAVATLPCEEADVLKDGQYAFSIKRGGGTGSWIIIERKR